MKKWFPIASKLVNVVGSLAAFAVIVVGLYQGDYKKMCFGVLMAGYFKLDRISDGLDRATTSIDLLVQMAAECRLKNG